MDELYDSSKTVVAVCAFFIPICTFFTSLRLWVRWRNGSLGADDYLFFVGLCLWMASTSFLFPACWNGLGAHAGRYTDEQYKEAMKYFFLFQDFYVWANIPIKSSLCLTLIRLSDHNRAIVWVLYLLILVTLGSSVGTNVYLLTNCAPLAATWDPAIEGAYCRPASGTVVLGMVYSGINIGVDWIVALLPVFLLWRVKLPLKQKLTVMAVLALGIFASCATLVRLSTLAGFTNTDDYLFGLAPMSLLTVAELGLALIAGGLVTLRPLFRHFFGGTTRRDTPEPDYAFRNMVAGRKDHMGFQRTTSADSQIGLRTTVNYGARDRDNQRSMVEKGNIRVTRSILVGESRFEFA